MSKWVSIDQTTFEITDIAGDPPVLGDPNMILTTDIIAWGGLDGTITPAGNPSIVEGDPFRFEYTDSSADEGDIFEWEISGLDEGYLANGTSGTFEYGDEVTIHTVARPEEFGDDKEVSIIVKKDGEVRAVSDSGMFVMRGFEHTVDPTTYELTDCFEYYTDRFRFFNNDTKQYEVTDSDWFGHTGNIALSIRSSNILYQNAENALSNAESYIGGMIGGNGTFSSIDSAFGGYVNFGGGLFASFYGPSGIKRRDITSHTDYPTANFVEVGYVCDIFSPNYFSFEKVSPTTFHRSYQLSVSGPGVPLPQDPHGSYVTIYPECRTFSTMPDGGSATTVPHSPMPFIEGVDFMITYFGPNSHTACFVDGVHFNTKECGEAGLPDWTAEYYGPQYLIEPAFQQLALQPFFPSLESNKSEFEPEDEIEITVTIPGNMSGYYFGWSIEGLDEEYIDGDLSGQFTTTESEHEITIKLSDNTYDVRNVPFRVILHSGTPEGIALTETGELILNKMEVDVEVDRIEARWGDSIQGMVKGNNIPDGTPLTYELDGDISQDQLASPLSGDLFMQHNQDWFTITTKEEDQE